MKKGELVMVSGKGRTKNWRPSCRGCVTGVRKNGVVLVRWDGTHFEDEMKADEVRIVSPAVAQADAECARTKANPAAEGEAAGRADNARRAQREK